MKEIKLAQDNDQIKIDNLWSTIKALRTGYQMNEINMERFKTQDTQISHRDSISRERDIIQP